MSDRFVSARAGLTAGARVLAIAGGLVLSAGALFSVAAILADQLGSPILGDTEMVEFAAAAAVASFLPWCQLNDGHVRIVIFTQALPEPVLRGLDAIGKVLFAVVVSVLAWRLAVGGIDAFERTRMTMFLRLPLWWGYAIAAVPMAFWVVVSWFLAVEAIVRGAPDNTRPTEGFEEVGP
ncbi:MAG: TRAP transporter small permease subunit [Pseudomonadota bacterium]